MSYRQFTLVLVFIVCLVWSPMACALTGAPTAAPIETATPTAVDVEAIAAQLVPVVTLDQAAEQFASALGTTPDVTRALVEEPGKADTCIPCDQLPVEVVEANREREGVPINEVPLPLEPGSAVWITVQDVVCLYVYNGRQFTPLSVRMR